MGDDVGASGRASAGYGANGDPDVDNDGRTVGDIDHHGVGHGMPGVCYVS